jgi:hypothetical protein
MYTRTLLRPYSSPFSVLPTDMLKSTVVMIQEVTLEFPSLAFFYVKNSQKNFFEKTHIGKNT